MRWSSLIASDLSVKQRRLNFSRCNQNFNLSRPCVFERLDVFFKFYVTLLETFAFFSWKRIVTFFVKNSDGIVEILR